MSRKLIGCGGILVLLISLISCPTVTMTEINAESVYTVRVYPIPEHGSLRMSTSYVTAGDWITVYVNPDSGYTLKTDSLKSFNEDARDLSGETIRAKETRYQIQVGSNRRITAEFEPVPTGSYSIHIDSGLQNGVIFSNPLVAAAGNTVTLTLIPDRGYDLKAGTLFANDHQLPDAPPYTFPMPARNVEIRAEFETKNFTQLKESAWNYLEVKQYDTAAAFYEEAWKQNSQDPEAIFYSSLAKLAGLLIDTDVRKVLGTLHMQTPGTLDDWICDGYSPVQQWWTSYTGTYTIGTTNYAGRDIVLPTIAAGSWGFVSPYSDFDIAKQPRHIQTFKNHLFWGLIASYASTGFNPLLENIQRDVFGKKFDEALKRAETFPEHGKVELHPILKARFHMEDYYGTDTTYVGKAELDYIFGVLKLVKAAIEYLSVYDWKMEMRNWLMSPISPTDGLDELLQNMFRLSDLSSGTRKYLWHDYPTLLQMLPFRNNFLRIRNTAAMPRARAGFISALEMMDASMGHWYGTANNESGTSQWIAAATGKYNWAKNGIAHGKEAITGGEIFYFPDRIPDFFDGEKWIWPAPDWEWPTVSTVDTAECKVYGLDIRQFFIPGVFSLQNIFATEMGGEAPQLWQIEWYEDRAEAYTAKYTGKKTLVTQPIERRGRQENVAGSNNAPYGKFSFMLNTKHLKTVFPRGFETYTSMVDSSVKTVGNEELLSDIFPSIAMWPWAPSYFGNTISATQLYNWYHLR